nr:cytadherence high molecular weight protein 2-like isoform X1 [Ipomoea batatas]
MSELPESTLYRLQVDAAKLPVSSYRRRGLTYATFQPFEVLDDAADLSNNQLNWTNLFLWNKFGKSLSAADAEAAKHILTIKTVDDKTLAQLQNMAKTLSDEFSENVLHTNNYEAKFYKIESRLDSLEKSVEEITNLTKQIAQRFGIE